MGNSTLGLNGTVPARVSEELKIGLLQLVDEAVAQGWAHTRACVLLGVADVRVHRWRHRLSSGIALAGPPPWGQPGPSPAGMGGGRHPCVDRKVGNGGSLSPQARSPGKLHRIGVHLALHAAQSVRKASDHSPRRGAKASQASSGVSSGRLGAQPDLDSGTLLISRRPDGRQHD